MNGIRFHSILFSVILLLDISVGFATGPPGSLSRYHRSLEGPGKCAQCHESAGVVKGRACLNCHREIRIRIENKFGYHRDKAGECAACHSEHNGVSGKLIDWNPLKFDHTETGFRLDNRHRLIKDCFQCHQAKKTVSRKLGRSFLFKNRGCRICHPSPHPGFQQGCTSCHDTTSWVVDEWRRS